MSYKILFLCLKNSARSQMAETILNHRAGGMFEAYSAGSSPAEEIHPMAVEVLTKAGYDLAGKKPKNLKEYADSHFDFVITLCDSVKEACPVFPGQPVYAHWGMPDPAEFKGTHEEHLRFFRQTMLEITNRINFFTALPFETLDRLALEMAVKKIAEINI